MERLRRAVRRVYEVRVSRTQVSCELVQCVVPDQDAGRHVEGAVCGIELLDCRTTVAGVAFPEDLLEVAIEQFMNPVRHRASASLSAANNVAFALRRGFYQRADSLRR